MIVPKCIYGNNKTAVEMELLWRQEQFKKKLANNEPRPKFTGSYKKGSVYGSLHGIISNPISC